MTTSSLDTTGTRTIEASEFRARCLELMDEVAETGEEIVITRHGRPVSRLAPYHRKPRLAFGRNGNHIRILGDIVSPMPAEWFTEEGEPGTDRL